MLREISHTLEGDGLMPPRVTVYIALPSEVCRFKHGLRSKLLQRCYDVMLTAQIISRYPRFVVCFLCNLSNSCSLFIVSINFSAYLVDLVFGKICTLVSISNQIMFMFVWG